MDKTSTTQYTELFSERLSELRIKAGLSAREMSLRLKQNPGYINNIEHGNAMPTLTAFFEICNVLSISPSDFFLTFETDEKVKETKVIVAQLDNLSSKQFEAMKTILSAMQ